MRRFRSTGRMIEGRDARTEVLVMAEKVRPERVAEEFREILAEEIPRLKDPRVGFVTVTRVSVSPDLRRATVFYTVLGENKDVRGTRAGLASARAFLRRTLGHQVRLKYTPELDFAVVDRVAEVAAARGVPAAQVALAWLLHKPGVTAPIAGATKLEHLDDAVAAAQLALDADEVARLEEPYVPHSIAGHS